MLLLLIYASKTFLKIQLLYFRDIITLLKENEYFYLYPSLDISQLALDRLCLESPQRDILPRHASGNLKDIKNIIYASKGLSM